MREILFRAKAINREEKWSYRTNYKNGDWVYGFVTDLYDDRFPNLPAQMKNTDGVSGIDVDYQTIGQYTGLTDNNGNKIFEGDIVRCVSELDYANMVVIFEDGEFRMVKCKKYNTYTKGSGYFAIRCFYKEIIGNIYDNPELIKG